MSLDELTAASWIAMRWRKTKTPENRLANYHMHIAHILYIRAQCPDTWMVIAPELQTDADIRPLCSWCLETLGYIPEIDKEKIHFRTPADETFFELRWRFVDE